MSTFDKKAADWDSHKPRIDVADSVANRIKETITISDKKIIDIGSGTGLLAGELTDCHALIAIDNSQKMLDKFNEKFHHLPHFSSQYNDAHKQLPSHFDVAVSSMTLHHIEHPKALFSDIYNALNNDGYLFFADLESEDGTFHSNNEGVYHFGFSKEYLIKEAQEVGFENVSCEEVFVIEKGLKRYPILLISGQKRASI